MCALDFLRRLRLAAAFGFLVTERHIHATLVHFACKWPCQISMWLAKTHIHIYVHTHTYMLVILVMRTFSIALKRVVATTNLHKLWLCQWFDWCYVCPMMICLLVCVCACMAVSVVCCLRMQRSNNNAAFAFATAYCGATFALQLANGCERVIMHSNVQIFTRCCVSAHIHKHTYTLSYTCVPPYVASINKQTHKL